MAEFLPLCDVLFNIISLTLYFCNIVFDISLTYALYLRGHEYSWLALIIILFSVIVCQIVSIHLNTRLHLKREKNSQICFKSLENAKNIHSWSVFGCHLFGLGVFWRYAKLFIPVDLTTVKNDFRDLCIIRLFQTTESLPMLLLQLNLYISIQKETLINNLETIGDKTLPAVVNDLTTVSRHQEKAFKDLIVVSAVLSLFSICWALASFSKHVKLKNVHRLVLTWGGVVMQFLWRLGTVSSRVIAITAYMAVFGYWIILVISIHHASMLIWLLLAHSGLCEHASVFKRFFIKYLLSMVFIISYINMQEDSHKQKMTTYYVVVFLENILLTSLWTFGVWANRPKNWYIVPVLVTMLFAVGIFFMFVYYRYFHVRRLTYNGPENVTNAEGSAHNKKQINEKTSSNAPRYPYAIPGVFNCRFSNPVITTTRKKKKPTSFVPPPSQQLSSSSRPINIPFWKRSQPKLTNENMEGENTSSLEPRINIQQKLQEKKEKQLAELKLIEEEIKQGKLRGPVPSENKQSSLVQEPIPLNKRLGEMPRTAWQTHHGVLYNELSDTRAPVSPNHYLSSPYGKVCSKKQIINSVNSQRGLNSPSSTVSGSGSKVSNLNSNSKIEVRTKIPRSGFVIYKNETTQNLNDNINKHKITSAIPANIQVDACNNKSIVQKKILRLKTQTPEILLTPHIQNSCVYYDLMNKNYGDQYKNYCLNNQKQRCTSDESDDYERKNENEGHLSDIDSQMSLPRSYTLPREFKYNRKTREKSSRNHMLSTNSSDGDVDSCDDNDYSAKIKAAHISSNIMRMQRLHAEQTRGNENQVKNLDLLNGHFAFSGVRSLSNKAHFVHRGYYFNSKYETKL